MPPNVAVMFVDCVPATVLPVAMPALTPPVTMVAAAWLDESHDATPVRSTVEVSV